MSPMASSRAISFMSTAYCSAFGNPETVGSLRLHVSNNTATGGCATNLAGITVNGTSYSTFDNNNVDGTIYIGTSLKGFNVTNNKLHHNTVTLKAGVTSAHTRGCFWLQANFPGAEVSFNELDDNDCYGVPLVAGFAQDNDYVSHSPASTMDGNVFHHNRATNVSGLFLNVTTQGTTNCELIGNMAPIGTPETANRFLPCNSGTFENVHFPRYQLPPGPIAISQTGFIPYDAVFRSSTTGLADITPLLGTNYGLVTFPVRANQPYAIEAFMLVVADAIGGQKYQVNCTCSFATTSTFKVSGTLADGAQILSANTGIGSPIGLGGTGATQTVFTRLDGFIFTITPGVIEFQFAQNAAGGSSSTVGPGSWFRVFQN